MDIPILPGAAAASAASQAAGAARGGRDADKVRDAAQQFEALLLSQILKSVRESGGSWLGSGSGGAADCATEFAEEQLATSMARQGGLGLANLIAGGLERK